MDFEDRDGETWWAMFLPCLVCGEGSGVGIIHGTTYKHARNIANAFDANFHREWN